MQNVIAIARAAIKERQVALYGRADHFVPLVFFENTGNGGYSFVFWECEVVQCSQLFWDLLSSQMKMVKLKKATLIGVIVHGDDANCV